MEHLYQQIKELAAGIFPQAVRFRRHLHQNPELSFQENNTSEYISAQLSAMGIRHQKNIAGYGIVGLIEGQNPSLTCVALRADMDALPIFEQSDKPYCSINPGVMHACGHDAHTAILLSVASVLQQLRHQFEGSIKLLFQPAEEKLPGGAIGMIEAGVLRNPDVKAIAGLHVLPSMQAGYLGFRSGPFMASSDEISIRISGKGGHAAMPDLTQDTILAASQVVVSLQQLASRMAPPLIPTVLSFGKITADGAHNVIPTEVIISGTFRTFDEDWRKKAHNKIREIATLTAQTSGATAEVEIIHGYPAVNNHPGLTLLAVEGAGAIIGQEKIQQIDARMTAEDFGRYGQSVPACFFRLGTAGIAPETQSGLHTPTFDIDENSLLTGIESMAAIALNFLNFNK